MSESKRILVVDDETSIREFLEIMLKREGYDVVTVGSATEALTLLKSKKVDVVISDISMPEMNGIELLGKIRSIHFDTAVIIMTAFGSTERAVEAMKLGATDYITKPFKIEEMKQSVRTAILSVKAEKPAIHSLKNSDHSYRSNIIGNSPQIKQLFEMIEKVSKTKANIMILGESGTGKELVAQAIHLSSPERKKPFVAINCAAVPENLFESELFGHKKGSFTGAVQDKTGILQEADGGTLFLDEVGDIPLSIQVKMLRAIQQKRFRAVGGTEDIQVDVRFICATNKNLEEMSQKGTFREDLFYRLNVIQIKLPPLRDRVEDVPLIAKHFLTKFNLALAKSISSISSDAIGFLMNYDFPGNIRELENIMERAVALEASSSISPESLPQKVLLWSQMPSKNSPLPAGNLQIGNSEVTGIIDLEKGIEDFERQHIAKALNLSNGVKKKAAALLGISFRSLRYRIEKYGIEDPNPEEKE